MKRMAIEDLADNVETLLKVAPRERILLTRNGEPFAFVSDASNYDWEDIGYMSDPAFWAMIRQRRQEKGGIQFEQVKAELLDRERAERKADSPTKGSKKHRGRRNRSAA